MGHTVPVIILKNYYFVIHFVTHFSHLHFGFPRIFSPLGSPIKLYIRFSSLSVSKVSVHFIRLNVTVLTTYREEHEVRNPHYAVFFGLLFLLLS